MSMAPRVQGLLVGLMMLLAGIHSQAIGESRSHRDIRGEAIFWPVQSGTDEAMRYVDRLLTAN